MGEMLDKEARRGKGVTREAQDIFDAFSRTMPARWDEQNIIVADAVTIAPPYRVDECRPLVAGDTAALARVRKVVSGFELFSLMHSHLFSFSLNYGFPADSFFFFLSYLNSWRWNVRKLNFAMLAPPLARLVHLPVTRATSAKADKHYQSPLYRERTVRDEGYCFLVNIRAYDMVKCV